MVNVLQSNSEKKAEGLWKSKCSSKLVASNFHIWKPAGSKFQCSWWSLSIWAFVVIIYFISLPGKMANKVPDPMVIIGAQRMILGAQLSYFRKDMRWASCPNTKVIRKGIRRNLFWMPFLIQNMPWYEELLLAQIIYIFLEDYFVLEGN